MSQSSHYMIRRKPKEPPLEEVRGDKRFHIGYYGKHIRARADLRRDSDNVIIADEVDDETEYKAGNTVRA